MWRAGSAFGRKPVEIADRAFEANGGGMSCAERGKGAGRAVEAQNDDVVRFAVAQRSVDAPFLAPQADELAGAGGKGVARGAPSAFVAQIARPWPMRRHWRGRAREVDERAHPRPAATC